MSPSPGMALWLFVSGISEILPYGKMQVELEGLLGLLQTFLNGPLFKVLASGIRPASFSMLKQLSIERLSKSLPVLD